jgi:hypothetical protein
MLSMDRGSWVLGLEVRRKEICDRCVERAGDVARRLCAEDGRRGDLGAAGRNGGFVQMLSAHDAA